jgi:hypothetical protein
VARCWLGAPNAIKGPTEAAFSRQSGNHLLIVGQRDEASLAMLGMSVLSLAAQYPVGKVQFHLMHSVVPGSAEDAFLQSLVSAVPHQLHLARGGEVPAAMSRLGALQKQRAESGEAGETVFILIHGLQKFKKLMAEDEFSFSLGGSSESDTVNPATALADLVTEGSSLGMHLICLVDTYNNVSRFLSRKALSEMEMRVLFQMSANDSATLIESPKASDLGLHKAIFYNQQEGIMETFRPYALPEASWVEKVGQQLRNRS